MASWLEPAPRGRGPGRRFARVRVVSLPLTDYSRFGHLVRAVHRRRGEDIRYLERGAPQPLTCPVTITGCSTPGCCCACTSMTATLPGRGGHRRPAEIVQHNYWRDAAWHHAINGTTLPPSSTWNASSVHEARASLGRRSVSCALPLALAAGGSRSPCRGRRRRYPSWRTAPDAHRRRHPGTGRGPRQRDAAGALLASLHTLEVQHAEWQRVLRAGLRPRQQELAEWDQRTRLFRAFEATVVPGCCRPRSTRGRGSPRASAA